MSSAPSLWVKKAKVEAQKRSAWVDAINRVFPLPFEERRARIGAMPYKHFRWYRYLPWIVPPLFATAVIIESRDVPHEHVFTALHLWLADHGVFRHDTIKALNPAFEHERMAMDIKNNDRKWRFTGGDMLTDKELREFAAINVDRARQRDASREYGL